MAFELEDRRKVKKGTLVNVAGGVSMASFKAFQFVLRQLFGGEAFGLYMIAYSLMELFSNFVLGGFGDAVTYHAAKHIHPHEDESIEQKDQRESMLYATLASTIRGSLGISLVLSIAFIVGAESLYQLVWSAHHHDIVRLLQVILLALPLLSLVYILAESTRAHLDMRAPVLVVQTLFPGLGILCALAFHFFLDLKIFSMAYGIIASLILCIPVALHEFSRYYSIKRTVITLVQWKGNPQVIRFAIPQCLNMASNMGLVKMDSLILSAFVPANSVGIYTLLVDLAQLIRLPKMAFSGIFGPLVARYQSQGNRLGIQESLRELALLTSLIGLVVLTAVQFFFPDLILGKNIPWTESAWIPWLLCVGPFMSVHFGLAGNLLLMSGHARLLLANSLGALALNLLLDWLWIPQYGLLGAAMAGAVSNFTISSLQIYEMNKLQNISFGWHLHWRGWISLFLALPLILWSQGEPWPLRLALLFGTLPILIIPNLILPGSIKHPLHAWILKIKNEPEELS